ncbi:hypothetical protein ABZU45_42825 [Streptomyces avermitilis]|uniref:hypothetical protein n=1 Tax=Streptomyces avermitilis TaxID=33903 RepID=UPI0033B6C3C8
MITTACGTPNWPFVEVVSRTDSDSVAVVFTEMTSTPDVVGMVAAVLAAVDGLLPMGTLPITVRRPENRRTVLLGSNLRPPCA